MWDKVFKHQKQNYPNGFSKTPAKGRKNASIIVCCGVICALLGAFGCLIMLITTMGLNADISKDNSATFFAALGLVLILFGALLFWFGCRRLSGTNSHLTDRQSSPQTAADSERLQQPCTRD